MTRLSSSLEKLDAVARGELSAQQWLSLSRARIEATDDDIHAYTSRTFKRARHTAKSIDNQRRSGSPLPPLAGLPYAVKNLFDIQGEVTLAGSKIHRGHPTAKTDAFLIQRMSQAGAVLTGALNMDEFAYGFTTENSHDGPTRNPHNRELIAGGSSGGSGAAVAAGQVPVALGSDTNGSIRVPSSLCGVWGLKPTFGRLSRRGTYPFVHSIDHLGPLADSAGMLARAYDALQGPDNKDPACRALAVQPALNTLEAGVDGLRIGVLGGYFEQNATETANEAVQMVMEALGAHTHVIWPEAERARAAAFIITAGEGGSLHMDELRSRADEFEPLSVDRFIAGALQPAHWMTRARRFRRAYLDQVNELFTHWDLLIAPATPTTATRIGLEWLDINGTRHPARAAMGLLTQPISFAGCPVAVAPLWPGSGHGLPIGVQLISAPWREDIALRAARALERAEVAGTRPARHLTAAQETEPA